MKQKTIIILENIIIFLRKSRQSWTCKEITINLREKYNIRIAYRDMHRYLEMIRNQLIVEKKGHSLYYHIDNRKKVIIENIFKR